VCYEGRLKKGRTEQSKETKQREQGMRERCKIGKGKERQRTNGLTSIGYRLLGYGGIEVDEGCVSGPFISFLKRVAVIQMERFEYESGGQNVKEEVDQMLGGWWAA
jgi:hypothetical protein